MTRLKGMNNTVVLYAAQKETVEVASLLHAKVSPKSSPDFILTSVVLFPQKSSLIISMEPSRIMPILSTVSSSRIIKSPFLNEEIL